jgi:flagellar P-ring protein precursor FlgI
MRRIVMMLSLLASATAARAVEIQSICRLKGQEQILLRGIGLVTGLPGTGDQRLDVTSAALARSLEVMGNPILDLKSLTSARNVALVAVTCTVPAEGGREGETIDCFVTSMGNARSLTGGRLQMTAMTGPRIDDRTLYGLAEGPLTIEGIDVNHARVERGVKLTRDFFAPFVACGDRINLVIDTPHASIPTADRISRRINQEFAQQLGASIAIARAIDAKNIEVLIPPFYREDVVAFAADVLDTVLDPDVVHTQARVIINEKTSTIVVTGEVEIKPLLVAHQNLLVFGPNQAELAAQVAQSAVPPNNFSPLVPTPLPAAPPFENLPGLANLNDLLFALDRAAVSAEDKIAIIRELDKSGKLHAAVIYE